MTMHDGRPAGLGQDHDSAKLAKRMKERQGKKVLMASLDDRRPAAKEQLRVLGEQIGVDTLPISSTRSRSTSPGARSARASSAAMTCSSSIRPVAPISTKPLMVETAG
jgi:signal recognition particle GTPase